MAERATRRGSEVPTEATRRGSELERATRRGAVSPGEEKKVIELREAKKKFTQEYLDNKLATSKINNLKGTEFKENIINSMLDVLKAKCPGELMASKKEFQLPQQVVQRTQLKIPKGMEKLFAVLYEIAGQVSDLENQMRGLEDTIKMLKDKKKVVEEEKNKNESLDSPVNVANFIRADNWINQEIKILEVGLANLAGKLVLWANDYLRGKIRIREIMENKIKKGEISTEEFREFIDKFRTEGENIEAIRKSTMSLPRPSNPDEELLSKSFLEEMEIKERELSEVERQLEEIERQLLVSGGYRKLRRKRIRL